MTREDLEFLVALNAREESFLYDLLSDISPRQPEMDSESVVREVLVVIRELYELRLLGLGRRQIMGGSDEEWSEESLPVELGNVAEWAWPSENEARQRWYLYPCSLEIEGRGLQAVSSARAAELMFGASGPNNSLQARRP